MKPLEQEIREVIMAGYEKVFGDCGFRNGWFEYPQSILKYNGPSLEGTKIQPQLFGSMKLPGFVFEFTNGEIVRLIPQNPKKASSTAALAAAGHRIAWVISASGKYLVKIVDGIPEVCK